MDGKIKQVINEFNYRIKGQLSLCGCDYCHCHVDKQSWVCLDHCLRSVSFLNSKIGLAVSQEPLTSLI